MVVRALGNSAASFRDRFNRTGNRASNPFQQRIILNVPVSINSPGTWTLTSSNPLIITTAGSYPISVASGSGSVTAKLWGSGGASSPSVLIASQPGGGGGFSQGTFTISPTFSGVITVGSTTGQGGPAAPPDLPSNNSGGYTGVFLTSVTQANSIIIAGGGGSPGWNDNGTMSGGGGGGGTTGQDAPPLAPPYSGAPGKGGTQSAGGAGGTGGFSNGTAGSALQGGAGGARGTNGAGGGSGGGGYYGGGGGGGQITVNTGGGGGGGGSGYIGGHPSIPITNGSTTQATSRLSAGSSDPSYPLVGIAGSGSLFPGGATGNGAIQIILI